METKLIKIEDLGYDEFFETNRIKLGLGMNQIARVISERRGAYKVKNVEGEYLAKISGKQIFEASSREDYPAVGDWISISELEENKAIVRSILPRKTVMKRKYNGKSGAQIIATNIDVVFAIESVNRDYNLNRLERYFAMASDSGIKPVVILNKIDLISKKELYLKIAQIKLRLKGVDIIATSALTDEGIDELKQYMKRGKTYCFLGSSGVGKSSLINKLIGNSKIKTGEIGSQSGRGKHTTTRREMYFLETGGIVIDNPGMREVGVTDMHFGIDDSFDEIAILAKECKFSNCSHVHEPGCEILAALKLGKIDQDKYSNYIRLKKEVEHYEMTKLEKKEKNRQFGKFIKKAKKDLKNYKYGGYDE